MKKSILLFVIMNFISFFIQCIPITNQVLDFICIVIIVLSYYIFGRTLRNYVDNIQLSICCVLLTALYLVLVIVYTVSTPIGNVIMTMLASFAPLIKFPVIFGIYTGGNLTTMLLMVLCYLPNVLMLKIGYTSKS